VYFALMQRIGCRIEEMRDHQRPHPGVFIDLVVDLHRGRPGASSPLNAKAPDEPGLLTNLIKSRQCR
jgi:hypothetical protein